MISVPEPAIRRRSHDGHGHTPTPAPEQGHHGLSRRQIAAVMGSLMLAMFLSALDQMIITSALRIIADELAGLIMQAWATTAYLITAVISTPLYGKLSGIYGRKPLYLVAISLFIVGSMLSGLAQSMYQLAAFRAVQGLGAGGLFSLALAILATCSDRRRGPATRPI